MDATLSRIFDKTLETIRNIGRATLDGVDREVIRLKLREAYLAGYRTGLSEAIGPEDDGEIA